MTKNAKISIIIPSAPSRGFAQIVNNIRQIKLGRNAVQIIIVKGTLPPVQRNMAVKKADGDYIFLFDDDVEIPKGVIEKALAGFKENPATDVIGGPNLTPPGNTFLQRCFGLAHASYFTGAFTAARYWPATKLGGSLHKTRPEHLISCNLAFRAKVLKENPFAPDIFPNEENELLNRLQKKGFTLKYDPDFFVYHHRRKNLASYIKQIFAWGRGRAIHLIRRPQNFSPAFFVPLLFAAYLVSLISLHGAIYFLPLLLYLILDLIFSLQAAIRGGSPACFFVLIALMPLTHLVYAAGSLWGFATFWRKPHPLSSKREFHIIEIELRNL